MMQASYRFATTGGGWVFSLCVINANHSRELCCPLVLGVHRPLHPVERRSAFWQCAYPDAGMHSGFRSPHHSQSKHDPELPLGISSGPIADVKSEHFQRVQSCCSKPGCPAHASCVCMSINLVPQSPVASALAVAGIPQLCRMRHTALGAAQARCISSSLCLHKRIYKATRKESRLRLAHSY